MVTTEHSRGDMLPEPSNAPRPEPIDVISERLRDGKVGNGPQQVIVETAERSKYLHGGKDEAVSLVCEVGEELEFSPLRPKSF